MERIQKLLDSLKLYYGLGVSNGIGTAGLKTAREEIKVGGSGKRDCTVTSGGDCTGKRLISFVYEWEKK